MKTNNYKTISPAKKAIVRIPIIMLAFVAAAWFSAGIVLDPLLVGVLVGLSMVVFCVELSLIAAPERVAPKVENWPLFFLSGVLIFLVLVVPSLIAAVKIVMVLL